jgi:hypothetical protein
MTPFLQFGAQRAPQRLLPLRAISSSQLTSAFPAQQDDGFPRGRAGRYRTRHCSRIPVRGMAEMRRGSLGPEGGAVSAGCPLNTGCGAQAPSGPSDRPGAGSGCSAAHHAQPVQAPRRGSERRSRSDFQRRVHPVRGKLTRSCWPISWCCKSIGRVF